MPSRDDEQSAQAPTGPLNGIRVLELGGMYAGPWVGRVLADLGARVIKIENPRGGDASRTWPPFKNGTSLPFLRMNRGKRSIGLNLQDAEGRDLVRALVSDCDVVAANFKPTTMASWQLDYDSLKDENPRLIYTGISGYGRTGPYSGRPGFGSTADAISGFSNIVGFPTSPPTMAHFGLADLLAGTCAALATAVCLFHREKTGRGDEVDVALYEPLMTLVGDIVLDYTALGLVRERKGNDPGVASPVGTFMTKDQRWVVISGSSQAVAGRLFGAIGRADLVDDPRYVDNAARLVNRSDLTAIIQLWVGERTRDEVLQVLSDHDVVCGPVNTAEDIVNDPHFEARTLMRGTSATVGEISIPAYLAHIASAPSVAFEEPPELGQHTMEILSADLGLSTDRIADLLSRGVIGPATLALAT
jgi:crotonobetainyl-CoA:carnitine CoA-transferase CaiB-like acyl-CoA transferase